MRNEFSAKTNMITASAADRFPQQPTRGGIYLADNRASAVAQRKPGNTAGPKNFVMQLMRNRKRWSPAQREQSRKFWAKKDAKDARRSASEKAAFMNSEVHKIHQEKSHGELALKVSGDFPLHEAITNVILQGARISGQHQDVICELASGKNLRFSRNNWSDTAQYGADVGRIPLINSYRPLRGSTVRNALVAFRGAHDAMRRYDHGDCQAFADELIHRLTGQRTGFGHADIDFM